MKKTSGNWDYDRVDRPFKLAVGSQVCSPLLGKKTRMENKLGKYIIFRVGVCARDFGVASHRCG